MPQMIFVNLPVKDLPKSIAFFEALGFSFNPQFTDDTAACMVISETIFAMLLTHEKFAGFSPKPIADTSRSLEVLTALSRDSREAVDAFYAAAIAAGGRDNGGPGLRPHYHPDYYGAFVFDPDGNNIEAVCHRPE